MNMERLEKPKHDPKPDTSADKVKLSIGRTVLVADRQRLIDSSPYFAALLRFHSGGTLDTVSMVPPENVQTDTFLNVLSSLCTANTKLKIGPANVWDIIILSKYFQLEQLEVDCLTALPTILSTLGMEEMCHLWRKWNTFAFGQVAALVLVGISLKMESASKCRSFLDLTVEELVTLMSGDSFLPLSEKDVCMAVRAWCEHRPKNRKTPEILSRVLAEVVWDDFTTPLLQPLLGQCERPEKVPKRAIQIADSENNHNRIVEEVLGMNGVVLGDYIYSVEGPRVFNRQFYRVNWKSGQRTVLDSEIFEDGVLSVQRNAAEYRLCSVRVADSNNVGCLVSYWMDASRGRTVSGELKNTIALYDTVAGQWNYLPKLPLPRRDTAVIQCGSFLYVVGGKEIKPFRAGRDCAYRGYRLDLRRLTRVSNGTLSNLQAEWEPIANLHAPRIKHCVTLHCGRVVVYGGKTKTALDSHGKRIFGDSRWSEAYDTTLNTWTVFDYIRK